MTESVSALFDEYEKEDRAWVFQAGIIGFALFVILAAVFSDLVAREAVIISVAATFIACSAIAGDTEEHKKLMRNHVIYANAGIVLAGLFVLFMTSFWYLGGTGVLATGYMLTGKVRNRTYWIELLWAYLFLIVFLMEV